MSSDRSFEDIWKLVLDENIASRAEMRPAREVEVTRDEMQEVESRYFLYSPPKLLRERKVFPTFCGVPLRVSRGT